MDNWYYVQNGRQAGPVTADFLRGLIEAGALGSPDIIWREGMAEWQPIASIGEFAASLQKRAAFQTSTPPIEPAPDYRRQQPLNYPTQPFRPADADDKLTPVDWVLCVLCSAIGCIVGIVFIIQGKKKGAKMVLISIAFTMLWGLLQAAFRHN